MVGFEGNLHLAELPGDNTTTIIKTNRTTFMVPSFKFMYQS